MNISQSLASVVMGIALVAEGSVVIASEATQSTAPSITGETLVATEILVLADRVEPGVPFDVAIVFVTAPSWHLYWKNGGDSGSPPTVEWTLPKGFEAGELRFPVPTVHEVPGEKTFVHDGTIALVATIMPPKDPGDLAPASLIKADLTWMTCKDICLIGRRSHEATLPREATPASTAASTAASARARTLLTHHPKSSLLAIGASAALDGESVLVQLPAGSSKPLFFPADTPGVTYGEPREEATRNGGKALRIPFTLKPQDALGKPLSVAGLIVVDSTSKAPIAAEFALAPGASPAEPATPSTN